MLTLLLPALTVAACDAARTVDAGLRNFDVLDRVFAPRWFRAEPPPVAPPRPVPPPVAPLAMAPPPGVVLEEPLPGLPGDVRATEARLDPAAGSDLPPAPPRAGPPRPAEPLPNVAPLPDPAPPPRAEPSPPPDPALRRRALLRQFPWVAQFWSELDRPQQARVSRRLNAAGTPQEGHAAAWDRMGLAERVDMLFGTRPSAAAQAAAGRN